MNERCGNCAFCVPICGELMCDNEESEGYGLSVDDDDYCVEFEAEDEE